MTENTFLTAILVLALATIPLIAVPRESQFKTLITVLTVFAIILALPAFAYGWQLVLSASASVWFFSLLMAFWSRVSKTSE